MKSGVHMKISEIKPEVYDMAKRTQEKLGGRFRETFFLFLHKI